jgi:hypothetical protein
MNELRYTLVSDGGSDRALIPILTWILTVNGIECAIQHNWADLRSLPTKVKGLPERIEKSYDLYPCDILFIHRDAEKVPPESRKAEIDKAIRNVNINRDKLPYICVIPVKMTEAWLLIEDDAIKIAAGNPGKRERLALPRMYDLETLTDPKKILHDFLKEACGLKGRRLREYIPSRNASRVSEFIADFSPLRQLPAFRNLEKEIKAYIKTLGTN